MAKVGDDYTWKGDRNLAIYDEHFEKSFISRVRTSSTYLIDKSCLLRTGVKMDVSL